MTDCAFFRGFLVGVMVLLLCSATPATSPAPKPVKPPQPPPVKVRNYILLDYHGGAVLAESQSEERAEPASLTKLMTAYVVFQELGAGRIQVTDQAVVSETAWRMTGSRTFLQLGAQVTIEDLLKGMIIQSGNDASVALAEHVAGSEEAFAELMNRAAQKLGMSGSHFVNSSGLPDPNHYTTAKDVALLMRAIIHDFPQYYTWYSQREFTYNGITQPNRNRLLDKDPSVDGGKTGHTDSAGYCLVTSAQREGMRLISVVLGAEREPIRVQATQALLNFGFRAFETHKLYEGNTALTEVRIWKGAQTQLPLGLNEPLYAMIPRGQRDNLQTAIQVQPYIEAPVAKGASYGTVKVVLAEKLLLEQPLVALQEIPRGGLWRRMMDWLSLSFRALWNKLMGALFGDSDETEPAPEPSASSQEFLLAIIGRKPASSHSGVTAWTRSVSAGRVSIT